jgi:hypothetical protein
VTRNAKVYHMKKGANRFTSSEDNFARDAVFVLQRSTDPPRIEYILRAFAMPKAPRLAEPYRKRSPCTPVRCQGNNVNKPFVWPSSVLEDSISSDMSMIADQQPTSRPHEHVQSPATLPKGGLGICFMKGWS